MGPDQLSSVMQTVSGKRASPESSEDRWKTLRETIEAQSTAKYSSARIWVGINVLYLSSMSTDTVCRRMTGSSRRPIRGMCWDSVWSSRRMNGRAERRGEAEGGEEGRVGQIGMRVDGVCSGCDQTTMA